MVDAYFVALAGLGILTLILFFVNTGFAITAVGTTDSWLAIQANMRGYGLMGLLMTILFMSTAWVVAQGMLGPTQTWIMTLILSVLAFSTAFAALSIAYVTPITVS
jgi:hypothetical protein